MVLAGSRGTWRPPSIVSHQSSVISRDAFDMSQKRPTAFVTGASQGLGAEIAVALAQDGCDVAVTSRQVERLSGTLGRIERAGARGVPIELDVRSHPGMERAMAEAVSALGRV